MVKRFEFVSEEWPLHCGQLYEIMQGDPQPHQLVEYKEYQKQAKRIEELEAENERLRDELAGMTAAADSLNQDVYDLTDKAS